MKELIGIVLLLAGTYFSFYFGHLAYLVQAKQREGLGPLVFFVPPLYGGSIAVGFYWLGTSGITAIALGNLFSIVGYIGSGIYHMSKTPFIALSKPEEGSKAKVVISLIIQVILISVLVWLLVIIGIVGYRNYFG